MPSVDTPNRRNILSSRESCAGIWTAQYQRPAGRTATGGNRLEAWMSKYLELSGAYKRARENAVDNRKQCHEFITGFIKVLADDLGCDPKLFVFYPANIKFSPANACPMEEALQMGMDGSWHFMLGLKLYPEPDTPPVETVYWEMSVFRGPAGFELRLRGVHEPYRFPPTFKGTTKTHGVLFDRIYKAIRYMYTEGFTRFTDRDEAGRPLSF
jgi:hypothetical protein